jgi:CubicO group peptidase (beta-lactamase class C family)
MAGHPLRSAITVRFRRADRSDPSGRAARPGAGPFLLAAVLMAAALGAGAAGCSSGGSSPGTASARARTAGPRALEGGPVALTAGKAGFPARARITRYLTSLAAAGRLSGTVLVSRGDREYLAAYGYADRAARTPNTIVTEFRLGSVSKQFTAMAVLMLAARHKLTITGRICRYLPGCPARWRAITVADLLDHSSGIPDYLNEPGATWPPRPATPAQLIATFRDLPLGFRPGTRMRYSNSGYVLAGALVQRESGQPLARFLTQRIFGPLGMHRTGTDTTAIRPGHAAGYYASGQRPVAYPMSAFFAAGGLYSTVGDLDRWDTAVQASRLIPARLTRAMLAEQVPCPPPGAPGGCLTASRTAGLTAGRTIASLGYGFGWFIDRTPDGLRQEHEGRIDGFLSYNAIYPASGEHVIVLANSEATPVQAIAATLARLTLRAPL